MARTPGEAWFLGRNFWGMFGTQEWKTQEW
jgi:hypothetical protein